MGFSVTSWGTLSVKEAVDPLTQQDHMHKEGREVIFVTTSTSVTKMTSRPSCIVSSNLARNTIMVLPRLKSYKDVCNPLERSGDIQKLEVLFHEDFSHAQTNRR